MRYRVKQKDIIQDEPTNVESENVIHNLTDWIAEALAEDKTPKPSYKRRCLLCGTSKTNGKCRRCNV